MEFEPKKWVNWENCVYIYLNTVLNARGAPLTHVICKGNRLTDDMIAIDEEIVWNAPLQVTSFNADSNTVITLLKDLCNGKNGDTCIKGI